MGSFLSFIIQALVLSVWPCLLFLCYIKFQVPTRFVLQNLFIISIYLFTSIICALVGLLIKYLTVNTVSNAQRIWFLSAIIFHSFAQVCLFIFEFWTNVRFVASDTNVDDDIFHLNSFLICNHSASPFDGIALASISDYLMRLHRSFVFMKRAFMFVPGQGWVGSLANAIPLDRNWNSDKIKIANVCKKFVDGIDYALVTPWMWYMYPEGTRLSKHKLSLAKQFAKERGFPVYNHLLQPRVKGFSYLTHHLYDKLGTIIDVTVLYVNKPPNAYHFLLKTRFCKYIHTHFRIYRKSDGIPKTENLLNQWLRDRWTEKDDILGKMKENKIKFKLLKRSPIKAACHYAGWTILINFIVSSAIFGPNYLSLKPLLLLSTCLFPIIIVMIEQSQQIDFKPDYKKDE